MPRIKKDFVLPFKGLRAFLGVEVGVGRTVLSTQEEIQRLRQQEHDAREQIQNLRQLLRQEKKLRWPAERFPDHVGSQEDEPQIFRTLISMLKSGKLLDLGAGPGTFSLIAAELGWEVTAVDARTGRTPDPDVEKDPNRAELIRSVRWVQSDLREFPIRSGEYDMICILRLVHYLDLNDQSELLRRCSDTPTLLNVRVAPPRHADLTKGSYVGKSIKEPGVTREEREQVQWASWGNEASFGHTEESLLRLALDCGYSRIWFMRPPQTPRYTYYLCLPSSQLSPLNR